MSEDRLKLAHSLVHDEPDEAMRICNNILNDHMADDLAQKALFMQGFIMMEAERFGLAYNLYQRCAQLAPEISEIHSNMGMCLEEYSPEQALKCFEKALELDNSNARALGNIGLMLLQLADPQGCIARSNEALAIDPDMDAPRHNKGLAQLMLRDWENGWDNFHSTLGVKHREARDYGLPEWNGEPGTVLVYFEQGVGDEIMYASCIEDITKTNDVILDCDKRTERLFRRSFGLPTYGTRFKRETTLLDEHSPDYQCAAGQLPFYYRRSEDAFPGKPYLKVDPERALQWRALFDTFKGKKIGIAWRGGLPNTGEQRRTMTLKDLEPLMSPENTYISLEYRPHDPIEGIKSYPRATGKGGDIDDLAALVGELDAVICPCTTVVYVAGALGVPCDVLVPKAPGYRYHLEGQFPWFESVRLHRQTGSWRGLAKHIAKRGMLEAA